MATHATGTFTVKNWDEQPQNDVDGHLKITRAVVAFGYSGELEGEGAMQYLMMYREDGSAAVLGLERISGSLNGKNGTFVLEHHGGYADGVASGTCEVVAGSGTDELEGLHGQGTTVARKDGSTEFTLDYDLR